jgi:hypothetical protein
MDSALIDGRKGLSVSYQRSTARTRLARVRGAVAWVLGVGGLLYLLAVAAAGFVMA